jgi:signal transduction histidine kinase
METADRVEKLVEICGDAPFHSDAVRIGIVVNNLVSNAIKYQNLRRNDAFVRIKVDLSPDYCTLTVSDNGIGIGEEHIDKIFNLFFRASVQSYGSGLGMYIVKNAVERLNGSIQLESALGEGSTVTVVFPSLQV